jgi:N-hydroxyarylamine O-acetyltransferase
MLDRTGFDLDSYLKRIACAARPSLEQVVAAHARTIPFENFDVLLKRPMPLDVGALFQKIVVGGRGGYCFEQNILLWAALEALGHKVRPVAARVLYRATKTLPRTHMLLLVRDPGGPKIVDVGFGGAGLLAPMPLIADAITRQDVWMLKLTERANQWTLATREAGAWTDIFTFGLEPQSLADIEMAHYYVSTHPGSRFTQTLVVQSYRDGKRLTLRNRELSIDDGSSITTQALADHAAVLTTIRETMGVKLPDDADAMTYGRAF